MKSVVAVALLALLLADASAQSAKRKATTKPAATKKATTAEQPKTETGAEADPSKESAPSSKTGISKTADSAAKKSSKSNAASSTSGKRKSASAASASAEKTAATSKAAGSKSEKKNGSTSQNSAASKRSAAKRSLDRPPQDNAGEEPTRLNRTIGPNITLDPEDLADFDANPEPVRRLLLVGLELTRRDLTYRYGSSDPSTGGMDCSGTMYYMLKTAGVKDPPRDSSGLYLWTQKEGTLRRVAPASLDDPALAEMKPGDLMFWEGTYEVQRDPPISHTMIYLGREKKTGLPVMVGASDGRTYAGISRNGVSVFDFRLPAAGSAARFVGFGKVPELK